jgi:hypothetical protein
MSPGEPEPAATLGAVIRPRDAHFHRPAYRDTTWTETNWFGFFVPEAHLRGSVYMLFRTNLGVARVPVLVYSKPSESVLDVDYLDDRSHVPIPPGPLTDYHLSNGVSVRMTAPMKQWTLRYEGRFDTVFDLVLDALGPPIASSESAVAGNGPGYAVFNRPGAPDAAPTGHIDQTMWVTGEVRVRGRSYSVDFASNRDHSWSPRREWGHNVCGNFDEGHFDRELSFHVQTRNEPLEVGTVTHGYILRRGVPVALKAGAGHYEYDGWRISRLVYELEDVEGRSYRFAGTPVSWNRDLLSGSYATTAVVRWNHDGDVGWGDYKWHWDVFRMQEHVRATEART